MDKPRYKPELLVSLSTQLKGMRNDLAAIERQMCQYESSCIKASVKTGNVLTGWKHLGSQTDSLEEALPTCQDQGKLFRIERLFSFSSPSTEKICKEMMTEQESAQKELENGGNSSSSQQSKSAKSHTRTRSVNDSVRDPPLYGSFGSASDHFVHRMPLSGVYFIKSTIRHLRSDSTGGELHS
uniref:Chromatin modification-related protein MEAF6 n=1 Tax=Trichuris muris TaxID=70415 RepID=A0A5S6QIZ0_TRIMR